MLKRPETKPSGVLRQLKAHSGKITGIAMAQNAPRLASVSIDGFLTLWDTERSRRIARLQIFENEVRPPLLNRARRLINAEVDELWNRIRRKHFEWHKQLNCVALSADATIAVVGGTDGVRVWSFSERRRIASLSNLKLAQAVSLSDDGNIAVAASGGSVAVLDLRHTNELRQVIDVPKQITDVAVSGDGGYAAFCFEHAIQVWDLRSMKRLAEWTTEPRKWASFNLLVKHLRFMPDGERLISTSLVGPTRIWDIVSGKHMYTLRIGAERPAISPDGQLLAFEHFGYLHVIEFESGTRTAMYLTAGRDFKRPFKGKRTPAP